jgi:RHS repeat-associated protein
LRVLPGQYFDVESGLSNNYSRDYDPSLGRYLESDPIGMSGGMNTFGYVWQSPLQFVDPFGLECWWWDHGYYPQCKPTGVRHQKPTNRYQTKQAFPAPDPNSPSITVAPRPPMPLPGGQLTWRTVFHDKGYWESELSCTVWATYVCKEDCGKLSFNDGPMDVGKKWEREPNSEYDDITYGLWSNVTAPSGPWDLEFKAGGGGRPFPRGK